MAFPFSDLPTAATITATEQMLGHLPQTETGEVVPEITKLAAFAQKEMEVVTVSLSKKRSGELTVEMNDADDDFDDSFEVFNDATDVAVRRKKRAAASQSAKIIKAILEKYGTGLHRLGRAEQIGKADSLVSELELPVNLAHMNTASIMADFEDMRDNHKSLKALMQESANLEAQKNAVTSPYKAGRALAKTLSELYRVVKINARIGDEDFAAALEKIDESLKKIRPLINSKEDVEE